MVEPSRATPVSARFDHLDHCGRKLTEFLEAVGCGDQDLALAMVGINGALFRPLRNEEPKRDVNTVMSETIGGSLLGRSARRSATRRQSRKSYIRPAVIAAAQDYGVPKGLKLPHRTKYLSAVERGLIEFLETVAPSERAEAA